MTNHTSPQVKLVLCDNEGLGRIRVELEPFFEFSFWMAEELQDLVAQQKQYVRRAAPRAASRLGQFL